jgi:hypothetical protein
MVRHSPLDVGVDDPPSLLSYAATAVLRDSLLQGGTRITQAPPDSNTRSLTESLGMSAPTLRGRLDPETYTHDRVLRLKPFFQDVEALKYGGRRGGQLWFLARRLFGTDDDRLNDRVHAEWWDQLRLANRYRGAYDVILSAEALIAWLRERIDEVGSPWQASRDAAVAGPNDSDTSDAGIATGRATPLTPTDRIAVQRLVSALGDVLAGGHGFATQGVDRMATLIRLLWIYDKQTAEAALEGVFELIVIHPGGNLAQRALDRCVRSASTEDRTRPLLKGLVSEIDSRAREVLTSSYSPPDLWIPDVHAVRLARVLARHGGDNVRDYWRRWLEAVVADDERADLGTRRAALWALAEDLLEEEGSRTWARLKQTTGQAHGELDDIWSNLTVDAINRLKADGYEAGWIDLVRARIEVNLDPVSSKRHSEGSGRAPSGERVLIWTPPDKVARLLSTHIAQGDGALSSSLPAQPGGVYQLTEKGALWPWVLLDQPVTEATRRLMLEALTTPSAIRVRTANEVLSSAGPSVGIASLAAIDGMLHEICATGLAHYPTWFVQRCVHVAALRGSAPILKGTPPATTPEGELLRDWVFRCRYRLMQRCLGIAEDLKVDVFLRARAAWSIGDLMDREMPDHTVIAQLLKWVDTHEDPSGAPEIQLSAVRCVGLLARAADRSRLLTLLERTEFELRKRSVEESELPLSSDGVGAQYVVGDRAVVELQKLHALYRMTLWAVSRIDGEDFAPKAPRRPIRFSR